MKAEAEAAKQAVDGPEGDDLRAARSEPEYLFRFRRPELYGPLAR